MKLWIKLVLDIFIIGVLVAGITVSYTFYNLSKMKTTKILKTNENLGIKYEVHLKQGDTSIRKAESQTLNVLQAVAYSRIRDTCGGDFVRTE